jgi:hypothetical protein
LPPFFIGHVLLYLILAGGVHVFFWLSIKMLYMGKPGELFYSLFVYVLLYQYNYFWWQPLIMIIYGHWRGMVSRWACILEPCYWNDCNTDCKIVQLCVMATLLWYYNITILGYQLPSKYIELDENNSELYQTDVM